MEKKAKTIKEELQRTLSWLDFSYICSLFLVANDKKILQHGDIQKWKLKTLFETSLKQVINDSHDPNKVILNFSSYEFSDVKKNVLCKDLNFSVKPKSIEYLEFWLLFKLSYRDIKQEKFVQWGFVFNEN